MYQEEEEDSFDLRCRKRFRKDIVDTVCIMRTRILKHICKRTEDETDKFVPMENIYDTTCHGKLCHRYLFSFFWRQKNENNPKEVQGEAIETVSCLTPIQNQEKYFNMDTLLLEDGIDATENLTGPSIREVNETMDYFWKKFDPNEKDHIEPVKILNPNAVKIRHKTQDESESAIEMFNL